MNASSAIIIRYGGINPNKTSPPPAIGDYVNIYNDIFNQGKIPIIQFSFDGVIANVNSQAAFAASVVQQLKTNGHTGVYFSIANEPENVTGGYGYDLTTNADRDKIITYIKTFANKIKEVDETAIIIART